MANISAWRRPFRVRGRPSRMASRRDAATPSYDPLTPPGAHEHVWLLNDKLLSLPKFRLGGLYSSANSAFTTAAFALPASGLFLNVDASFHGKWKGSGPATGTPLGCDESCNAYVMVGMMRATAADDGEKEGDAKSYVNGMEPENCILRNVNSTHVPLAWTPSPGEGGAGGRAAALPPAGTYVRLRIFFRDATVYAVDINA